MNNQFDNIKILDELEYMYKTNLREKRLKIMYEINKLYSKN